MELRQYWQIVRRRLWIVIVLLIVVVASVVIQPKAALTYQASMRFMLGLEPEAKIGNYYS